MRAFITGITGQDGAYLAQLLLSKGYEVVGGSRRSAERSYWRLEKLGILDKVKIVDFDLTEYWNIKNVIKEFVPDEFYNLGAMSFVGTSFNQPELTYKTNGESVLYILDALRQYSPQCKFYQASTSEMFGKVHEVPQDEETPFHPRSPYGVAKLFAHWITKNYREAYGMKTYCGILFNHESPLRGNEFVTQKIAKYVKNWDKWTEPLHLGNLSAQRDWGFAGDYVEAMYLMLQGEPDDYVVGTGLTYSVENFVNEAFKVVGKSITWEGVGVEKKGYIDGKTTIVVDKEFFRPAEVDLLLSNPAKIKEKVGWKAKTGFNELVKMMVEA